MLWSNFEHALIKVAISLRASSLSIVGQVTGHAWIIAMSLSMSREILGFRENLRSMWSWRQYFLKMSADWNAFHVGFEQGILGVAHCAVMLS